MHALFWFRFFGINLFHILQMFGCLYTVVVPVTIEIESVWFSLVLGFIKWLRKWQNWNSSRSMKQIYTQALRQLTRVNCASTNCCIAYIEYNIMYGNCNNIWFGLLFYKANKFHVAIWLIYSYMDYMDYALVVSIHIIALQMQS